MALILFLAGVNYLGVRLSGAVQVALTGLKVALIGGIIVVGWWLGHGHIANFHTSMPASPGGVAGFFAALVAALWAYDGWNNAGMLGSEIVRPERILPRALILGTGAVIVIYLLTNFVYFYVLTGPEVGASARVAAEVMRHAVGAVGSSLVSVAAMISIFAALNGSMLSGSRVPYAMARDGYFFRGDRARRSPFSYAGSQYFAARRVVLGVALERPIPRTLHAGHFPQLDFIRHDGGGGHRAAGEAAGDAAALSGTGISDSTRAFCSGGGGSALFDVIDVAARIGHWVRLDCNRITLLLSLEKRRGTV